MNYFYVILATILASFISSFVILLIIKSHDTRNQFIDYFKKRLLLIIPVFISVLVAFFVSHLNDLVNVKDSIFASLIFLLNLLSLDILNSMRIDWEKPEWCLLKIYTRYEYVKSKTNEQKINITTNRYCICNKNEVSDIPIIFDWKGSWFVFPSLKIEHNGEILHAYSPEQVEQLSELTVFGYEMQIRRTTFKKGDKISVCYFYEGLVDSQKRATFIHAKNDNYSNHTEVEHDIYFPKYIWNSSNFEIQNYQIVHNIAKKITVRKDGNIPKSEMNLENQIMHFRISKTVDNQHPSMVTKWRF